MDTQDNSNTPPDSWEQEADNGAGDQDAINEAAKSFSMLNVNAAPFIPGQNPYAAAFVPTFVPAGVPSDAQEIPEKGLLDLIIYFHRRIKIARCRWFVDVISH